MNDGRSKSVSFLCMAVLMLIQFLETFVSFWDFGNSTNHSPSSAGENNDIRRLRLRLLTVMDQVLLVLLTQDSRNTPNLEAVIDDALERLRHPHVDSTQFAQSAMRNTDWLNPLSASTVGQFHQPSLQTTTVENTRLSVQRDPSTAGFSGTHAGTTSRPVQFPVSYQSNADFTENAFTSSSTHQTSDWNALHRPVVQSDTPPVAHAPYEFYRSMPKGTEFNTVPSQLLYANVHAMPRTASSSLVPQQAAYVNDPSHYSGTPDHNVGPILHTPAFVADRTATPGPSRLPPPGEPSQSVPSTKGKRKHADQAEQPKKRGRGKTKWEQRREHRNPYPGAKPKDEGPNDQPESPTSETGAPNQSYTL